MARTFGVTGDTTIGHELTEDTWHAGLKVMPLALAVLLLLLFGLLRSRSAPLYLVASSLLAVAAALGLTVYVFQDLLGYNEIAFFVPVATAIVMLALGADYNVFLVSRIWREAERSDLQGAIRTAGCASLERDRGGRPDPRPLLRGGVADPDRRLPRARLRDVRRPDARHLGGATAPGAGARQPLRERGGRSPPRIAL